MAGPGRTQRQRQPRRAIVCYRTFVLLTAIMLMLHEVPTVQADILVYQMLNDQIIEEFRDLPGTFGGEIPDTGMKVLADRADPADGCSEMRKPPNSTSKFAVVIARYNCSFEEKVRNAQKAGYAMAIVHNVGSNDLEHMSASHPQDLLIPSVFVGESSGRSIIEAYTYEHEYALVITDDIPFNISNNLIIPFAIVVGLCFIIMVLFMIIRCIRERRRTLRNRLPARMLKRIGTVQFVKGMHYETCAICLEDFVEYEQLRVLPCRHAYHAQCIDPWLTKNRRVCPICKRKVIVRGERRQPRRRSSSDSMSSSDTDENTPLLNSTNASPATAAVVAAAAAGSPPSSSSYLPSATVESSSSAAAATAGGVGSVIQTSPQPTQPSVLLRQQMLRAATQSPHVINVPTSDDELLDDRWVARVSRASTEQQQQQPMDESPYSPIRDEAVLSRWQRFKRLFTSNEPIEDDGNDNNTAPVATQPAATASTTTTGPATVIGSSNNILNAHLAGSFHGSEDTTDDELLGAMHRDVAKRRQFRSAPDMPSTSVGSGSGVRVGVAALPNVNFNPTLQPPTMPSYQQFVPNATGASGIGTTSVSGNRGGGAAGSGQSRRSRPRARPNIDGGGSHIV